MPEFNPVATGTNAHLPSGSVGMQQACGCARPATRQTCCVIQIHGGWPAAACHGQQVPGHCHAGKATANDSESLGCICK